MPPIKHSILGASSSKRWMNCPGSVRMCAPLPRKTTAYADEGTAAHVLGEHCLRVGLDAADLIGQEVVVYNEGEPSIVDPNGKAIINYDNVRSEFVVDEDMAEAVQVRIDLIRDVLATYPGAVHHLEQGFHLKELHEDLWGTADDVVVVPFHKLIVADYKHGRGVSVDAEENSQAMLYALGAAWDQDLEEVEIIVIQPNSGRKEGGVKRWTTTRTALMEWGRNVLLPAALATEKPDAPLKAGPWCRDNFCAAAGICPAQRQAVMEAASIAFDDNMLPVESTPTLPAPSAMTSEELAKSIQLATLVEPWFKSLWAYAYDELMQGRVVPGYKIVRGKPGNRKYVDEKAAEGRLVSHLRQEAYERPKLKSPAQAEKALKALMKEGKLRDIKDKKELDNFVASLCTRADGRLMMVQESDPRPAVNRLPEAVFADEFSDMPDTQPSIAVCSADDF